jgi:prepilin-type N-terminal cleavage/methylation domain-containing protein
MAPIFAEQRHRPDRGGFSLLEIMLALAILGGSLAVLSRIADTGISAAREARDLSVARLLCQAKLSELLLDSISGVAPQSVSTVPLDSFDSQSSTPFHYSVEVEPAPLDGLLAIRVTVVGENPDGGPPLARYALVRWMVDPALGLAEAEAEEEAMKEEAAAAEEAAL